MGTSEIEVVWTEAYGANGYDVYRKVDDAEWQWIGDVTDEIFTDRDAAKAGKYVYTVVPYSLVDGEKCYGKFNYWGRAVEK